MINQKTAQSDGGTRPIPLRHLPFKLPCRRASEQSVLLADQLLIQWEHSKWTSEVLDGCTIFYFLLFNSFSKVSKGVMCYVAAMSTVSLFQVWNNADKSRFYYLAI